MASSAPTWIAVWIPATTFAAVPPMFCEPWPDDMTTPVPRTWCEATINAAPRVSIWSGRVVCVWRLWKTPLGERTTNGRKTQTTTAAAMPRQTSPSRRPRVRQAYATASGMSTPGQSFAAIPAPSSACPSLSRPDRSAAVASATSVAGQRSKRERMTEPSNSGATAASASAPNVRNGEARSAASDSAIPIRSTAMHAAISASNDCRKLSTFPASLYAGRKKNGSAPGGYSTPKSRYGTSPRHIASP